jgi:hypothetical protein
MRGRAIHPARFDHSGVADHHDPRATHSANRVTHLAGAPSPKMVSGMRKFSSVPRNAALTSGVSCISAVTVICDHYRVSRGIRTAGAVL